MASNKNQHFVPRCYLRPFTIDSANSAINIYNIDRQKFIESGPVKNQCSGDYFYGKDPLLEKAIQAMENAYGNALRVILGQGYALIDDHRNLLKTFWLLQHLRTEAASKRAVEMNDATCAVAGLDGSRFRLEIREAVQMAMKNFTEFMGIVSDLKVCLLRNRTRTPFITSDDPAVLTNRWHIESTKAKGQSFGLQSAGDILLLPLSPKILCLGYDGDVYSVPHHKNGWVEVRRDSDVAAFNQHQFLNCRANLYVQDPAHSKLVHESFLRTAPRRPEGRHVIHYAMFDCSEGGFSRYRVVNRAEAGDHEKAIMHMQVVHAKPDIWPWQISWRTKAVVFTNGTGLGYVRRAWTNCYDTQPFRKEFARGKNR
jgi:hypothetical protein